jgi:hypothetical protein
MTVLHFTHIVRAAKRCGKNLLCESGTRAGSAGVPPASESVHRRATGRRDAGAPKRMTNYPHPQSFNWFLAFARHSLRWESLS